MFGNGNRVSPVPCPTTFTVHMLTMTKKTDGDGFNCFICRLKLVYEEPCKAYVTFSQKAQIVLYVYSPFVYTPFCHRRINGNAQSFQC